MDATPSQKDPVPTGFVAGASRWGSAFSVAVLVLLAGGGAARQSEGLWLGLPSPPVIVLAAAAGALVFVSGVSGLGGFLAPAALALTASLWLPAGASLLLFSGPPLFALSLGGVALALVAWGRCPPRRALLPAFVVIYALVAHEARTRVGPDGDEPQYLMVADSLVRDHDLALEQDFKDARYTAFFSRPLEPHFRIRGPQGEVYSLHAVGLPVLILPAYAVAGYPGASFFMALLAALLVREIRRLIAKASGDERLAEGAAWLVGLSPPLIHFAGLIFTEIPAALLLCLGLRAAVFGTTSRTTMVAALCAAALPWLNVRYAILSLAVVLALGFRLWREVVPGAKVAGLVRRGAGAASILVGSALAMAVYHFELWGFFDPRRVYGKRREFSLEVLPEGLPGLFFDQEFGLFIYAPIFALSLAGFRELWRRERGLAVAALFAAAGVIATASVWPMWRGGFNPPSRFLTPLLPILAVTLALSLKRGLRPSTALLAGWGLWCGLGGALHIETVHRDRDGTAPYFRTQSGAREWTAALPSFVLSEDRPTRALAWPWAILLVLPVISAVRGSGRAQRALRLRDTALPALAFVAAAVTADNWSPRVRAPERDAVRLVGEPAVLLPSLGLEDRVAAEWRLDLFHEPHRAPAGTVFAQRLRLAPGRYRLTLVRSEPLGATLPDVVLIDRTSRATRTYHAQAEGLSMSADFEVALEGEFDLALAGGGPQTFTVARLRRTESE